MAMGHLFCDMNQGALPAILPFLIFNYNFNYAAVAGLIFAANIVSSVFQPFIGLYSDKVSKRWMVPLGLLLGSGGLAIIGFLPNYGSIFIAVMLSGMGIAIFHPEAAKTVTLTSGKNKASSMSIFSLGGTIGFALGPIVVTTFVLLWDLQGLIVLIVPSFVMGFLIMRQKNKPTEEVLGTQREEIPTEQQEIKAREDRWKPFFILSVVLSIRSIVFYNLNTFIPIFWITVLFQSSSSGNVLLSIFLLSGAVGTLIGGRIGDQYEFVKIIRISFILLVPILFILSFAKSSILAGVLIILAGMLIFIPYSSMVVLGQNYLPNRVGLASGITLGVAVSVGGIFAPLFGKIADIYGAQVVMFVIFCTSIIAIVFSFILSSKSKN